MSKDTDGKTPSVVLEYDVNGKPIANFVVEFYWHILDPRYKESVKEKFRRVMSSRRLGLITDTEALKLLVMVDDEIQYTIAV